ncbi:MAG: hypothetical protein VX455_00840 [Candidatus Neomarinimicrobiota bacterium]|nr:hypothetical protein [Candidatus Neomarinimicrobiota bacterium]
MKKMMVLAVLFINSAFGFSDPYQTFLKFINESGSLKMSLEFYQIQYGDHFDTAGDFYYLRDQYYFFDDAVQRIIFQDDEISTISKINKQIILDNIIPGEVTIFDILSGENELIVPRDAILEKEYYKIPFTIPSWELSGMIRVLPTSGRPLEIKLSSGPDQETRIKINSAEPWDCNSIPEIDLTGFEKIDLRE